MHRPVAAFQAAVALLQPIVRVAAGAVPHACDALGLELTNPGFHFNVLSEFRAHLVAEMLCTTLDDLAAAVPDWVRAIAKTGL